MSPTMLTKFGKWLAAVAVLACLALLPIHGQAPSLLLKPDAPEMNRRAPDRFNARLETSKGVILIEIHRDWAPNGVDRFYNLVRAGYYDQMRFHRVIEGKWAQFGVNGDPKVSNIWRARTIPDDPCYRRHGRGGQAQRRVWRIGWRRHPGR